MKKFFLLCLIFPCIAVSSSELTEDYLDIATNYATFGNYKEAVVYLDKIIQLEPSNNEVKDLKHTLLRLTNPNSKSYLTTKFKAIRDAKNYKIQGSKSKEITTLNTDSNNFWAISYLAEHYRKIEDYKNAIYFYQKAAELKPEQTQIYLGITQAYLALNDYPNALKSINKYIAYNSESDIACALRAEANMNLNNLNDAENDIKKALSIDENFSYLLTEAKILYFKGDYKTAREKLNILSANIQTAEVYKYVGLCDYALNNYTSALLNIDKAIILSDDDKNLNSKYNEIKSVLEKK
jgi:hypothetical protein